MSLRQALELSNEAAVRSQHDEAMSVRLLVGWDQPTDDALDHLAASPLPLVEVLGVVLGAMRDFRRWLAYRLRRRKDWWVVVERPPEAPTATRHDTRALAVDHAEGLLTAAIEGGAIYLPYGRNTPRTR